MRSSDPHPPARPSTADLIAWDRHYLWHPFTPMKPWCEDKDILIIARGDREFLIDTQGRRYIDGVSSLWCNVHGHHVPELDAAVRDQLARVAHSTLLGLANVPSIALARRLVELARSCGLKLDRVFYSDNGSTAVEVACKMAYQYWRNQDGDTSPVTKFPKPPWRSRFLALDSAYHGDTLGAVAVGGIPLFHHAFKGLCFPVDFVPPPTRADAGRATLARIKTLLESNPDAYAALIIEPLVQGAGGMLMHPPGFLRRLRTLANRYDVLLIADEVMTGFGRTGRMFACQHERVTPDLLCLSKGLTGGYMPLGATLTTRRVFNSFYVDPSLPGNLGKTFFHGHTFTGHPLACAVALASLDLFTRRRLLRHVQSLMPILAKMLAAARRRPFVADARQCGLIGAIDLVDATGNAFPPHWRVGGEICRRLRPAGILLRPLADTLVLMPPLAITPPHLRTLCNAVLDVLPQLPQIIAAKSAPSLSRDRKGSDPISRPSTPRPGQANSKSSCRAAPPASAPSTHPPAVP
jgi:adenosylmethionine-8-amino-7-oxononanoate aminotransferase